MLPFNESWFVVTFTGEVPASKLIQGWDSALQYIDHECGWVQGGDGSMFNPCAAVHDVDNWGTLNGTYQDVGRGDERHTFNEQVDEGVHLSIVRLTEPVEILAAVSN